MKRSTILIIITVVAAFIALRLGLSVISKRFQKSIDIATAVPHQYLDLFTPETQKHFTLFGAIKYPSGQELARVLYVRLLKDNDVDNSEIAIFETKLKTDTPLSELISINTNPIVELKSTFTDLHEGGFNFEYKDGGRDSIDKVAIGFNGALYKLNRSSANVLYYEVDDFQQYNIVYGNGSEFWAQKTDHAFMHKNAKLIFLKKGKELITIIMADTRVLPPNEDNVMGLFEKGVVN